MDDVSTLFPNTLDPLPVRRNLELLTTYRDKAVHFYNEGMPPDEGPLAVHRIMAPNLRHPLRQKEGLEKVPSVGGRSLTSQVFQAIAWKHNLRSNDRLCWRATEGVLTSYANDIILWLKELSADDV